MDTLEKFLIQQTNTEPQLDHNNSKDISNDNDNTVTFGDQLNADYNETFSSSKSWYKFNKQLENRYYSNEFNKNINNQNTNSISSRIQSYKYKKRDNHSSGGGPRETKIYSTPLSYKAKYRNNNNNDEFQSIDPRFTLNPRSSASHDADPNSSGWKLRNAYKFLDDIIDRDIDIIKNKLNKNKNDIKLIKKKMNNKDAQSILNEIKYRGVTINTLKNELKILKNRQNSIKEKDLEQRSKSQIRKIEIEQIKKGNKMVAYHHTLKRTRFGAVKWTKNHSNNNNKHVNIQNVYLKNKYNQLKKEGKLEKYMKKKTKRLNSKYKAALKKKSGAGWNDT